MKKMIMIVLVLVLGVAVLAACNCEQGNTPGTIALTSADNGKSIEVAVGTNITITLAENQTTPVHWQDKPETEGDTIISEVSSEYITDPNPDGKMGVGGKRIFKFEAKTTGSSKLKFKSTHISDPADVYDEFVVTISAK